MAKEASAAPLGLGQLRPPLPPYHRPISARFARRSPAENDHFSNGTAGGRAGRRTFSWERG